MPGTKPTLLDCNVEWSNPPDILHSTRLLFDMLRLLVQCCLCRFDVLCWALVAILALEMSGTSSALRLAIQCHSLLRTRRVQLDSLSFLTVFGLGLSMTAVKKTCQTQFASHLFIVGTRMPCLWPLWLSHYSARERQAG